MEQTKPALLVTIDTETDNLWARVRELSFSNIQVLPSLHSRLTSWGVVPTYLISYPVATAPVGRSAIEKILGDRHCEIGAHLHPWTTPPFGLDEHDGFLIHPMPSDLSDNTFRAKLECLTESIELSTTIRPVSYRAGRWGFRASHVKILELLGYIVDSSVTPGLEWADSHDHGNSVSVDYRKAPLEPYLLAYADVCQPGQSSVLEVPVSITICGWGGLFWARPGLLSGNALFSKVARLFLLRQLWLRPTHATRQEMLEVANVLFKHHATVLNIMFHSSEVIPGGSPYNRTEKDVQDFYLRLERVITHAIDQGAQPLTLKNFAMRYSLPAGERVHV